MKTYAILERRETPVSEEKRGETEHLCELVEGLVVTLQHLQTPVQLFKRPRDYAFLRRDII
ncbi:hypothetical protein HYX12_03935 [Candidatus Woesearchaeota archaeon]|nr:hypothetical protein [Candidatus Woesearchaeota archaeon]